MSGPTHPDAARAPRLLPYLAALWLGSAAPADVSPPRAAEPARLAAQSLLSALARAGTRLVAVGDRGIIVSSSDDGLHWSQAKSVPTQALLTGVCFFDALHGLAVGHDQVILRSADGGDHWQLVHYAPSASGPLLDVWCGAGGHAVAVGAYSAYLASADAGVAWAEREFHAEPAAGAPAAAAEADGRGGGYHLNRIVAAATRLYIAAEAGHLYRSDDGGEHWRELPSPYQGSFFGVQPLEGDALLAFGLRGNLFRSEDAGASWQHLDSGTVALLDGAARLSATEVAVVGLSGVVLLSEDDGRSFRLHQQSDRAGLAAAWPLAADRLVVAGEDGARQVGLGRSAPP